MVARIISWTPPPPFKSSENNKLWFLLSLTFAIFRCCRVMAKVFLASAKVRTKIFLQFFLILGSVKNLLLFSTVPQLV